jgi:MFS transporter, ACS family, hexuronate transporter
MKASLTNGAASVEHLSRWPGWKRWFVVCFFLTSSSLNYLDRLLLASLAPVLKAEYHLTNNDYANLLAAFSLSYALLSPALGFWMDRKGLTTVATIAVVGWSVAGILTGFVRNATQLLWCRVALGTAEAGGIPGSGKAYGTYLLPKERALGAGVGQLAISVGSLAAPLLAAWALSLGHWKLAFIVAGALGLVWAAGWLLLNRAFPPPGNDDSVNSAAGRDSAGKGRVPADARSLLRDSRYWRLLAANFLWMSIYTLWPNWTTLFLTSRFSLTTSVANSVYAWLPPLGATLGALAGGLLSMSWINRGTPEVASRLRVCFLTAVLCVMTAFVPFAPTPALATLLIGLSYCFVAAGSTNLYTIPIDLYGAGRAGFAISGFVAAFGLTQVVFNKIFGYLTTYFGDYRVLCVGVSVLPLVAYLLVAGLKNSQADGPDPLPRPVSGGAAGPARYSSR